MDSARLGLFVLCNLGIVAGYVFLGLFVVPKSAPRLRRTKIGGIFFFSTCALTHLELAGHALLRGGIDLDDFIALHMLAIHLVQVVSVWLFVSGLYVEFVRWGPWQASRRESTLLGVERDEP